MTSGTTPINDLHLDGEPEEVQSFDWTSVLISSIFHLIILVLLAFWVLPQLGDDRLVIDASSALEQDSFEFDQIDDFAVNVETPVWEVEEQTVEVDNAIETFNVDPLELPTEVEEPISQSEGELGVQVAVEQPSLSVSGSVNDAVDRVIQDVRQRLNQGDLLVVWLLDSSHSLVDDRQRVAERLTPFYATLANGRDSSGHQLLSTVVSYGASMNQRVAPTTFGVRIVNAVENLPIDRTGHEKVFEAVGRSSVSFRERFPKHQILVVVWTDESGDDVNHLEPTIQVCKKHNVAVSVVGPSSVLGADTGLHSYTDPKSKSVYQLPVRRGPDTAVPERLELDYWYPTRRVRRTPSWHGGPNLSGVLCGYSPYSLTRLTLQTGGNYTIFDRAEDRPRVDRAQMARYQPSYGSLQEYEDDVQSSPLRRAVMNAVGETRGKKIAEPTMMLFTKATGDRPFDFMRYYYPPAQFRQRLAASRGRLKGQAIRAGNTIDKALRHLSTDDDFEHGLEEEYAYDQSPRWRAWYDLTRGRLLAASVRFEEYRLIIDEITSTGALKTGTNYVMFVPSQTLRSDPKFQRRGEEAERLLRRCASQNRGTPWEVLANAELNIALGIDARQMTLTPTPGGGPAPNRPVLPRF